MDVIKLRSNNRNPARCAQRLACWRRFFAEGGAISFRVLSDPRGLAGEVDL